MKILLLSATSLLLASAVHAQVSTSVVVSGEENAAAEQQLFPQLLALRQVDGSKARSG